MRKTTNHQSAADQTLRIKEMQQPMWPMVSLMALLAAPAAASAGPAGTPTSPYTYEHHPVATQVGDAQRAFDRGLTLVFAYQSVEAEQSFRQAARLDPTLAMAWWGIALALGPNINTQPTIDGSHRAAEAIARARSLLGEHGSAIEREYIEALATRYSAADHPDFDQQAITYRDAMQALIDRHPDDADAVALYAEAAMDLRPWRLWTTDGKSEAGTEKLLTVLESGLRKQPDHIGLLHFYIHASEAGPDPGRALAVAHRLSGLPMEPAAAHLVHMPAHIYLRVGDWQAGVEANHHAVHHALDYRQSEQPSQTRACGHCVEFLVYALSMQGNYALAHGAALDDQQLNHDPTSLLQVLARFGQWDELLTFPEPAPEKKPDGPDPHFLSGFWHYARGLALAATARPARAQEELAALRAEQAKAPAHPEYVAGQLDLAHSTDKLEAGYQATILAIASQVLEARLLAAGGDNAGAIAALRAAVDTQDQGPYGEPPPWYFPLRESLGGMLLRTGAAAEAASVFAVCLERTPHDARALFGLAAAQRALGLEAEAANTDQQFKTEWAHADRSLSIADL